MFSFLRVAFALRSSSSAAPEEPVPSRRRRGRSTYKNGLASSKCIDRLPFLSAIMLDSVNGLDLALGGLGAVLLAALVRRQRQALPLPPGPPSIPLIGGLLSMPSETEWLTFAEWGAKYGTSIPSSRSLLLTSARRHLLGLRLWADHDHRQCPSNRDGPPRQAKRYLLRPPRHGVRRRLRGVVAHDRSSPLWRWSSREPPSHAPSHRYAERRAQV